jgi:selenide, water dikinase
MTGKPLEPFHPQKAFLGLISAGHKHAIATRGPLAIGGDWLWSWKDSIDRAFMTKFGSDIPTMQSPPGAPLNYLHARCACMMTRALQSGSLCSRGTCAFAGEEPSALRTSSEDAKVAWAAADMRCRGCAAKVPASVLASVLATLAARYPPVHGGGAAKDDAAVIPSPPDGLVSVQTVDVLSACVSDPFLFGGIAAVHAMADCFAMGADPVSALAVVQVCPCRQQPRGAHNV